MERPEIFLGIMTDEASYEDQVCQELFSILDEDDSPDSADPDPELEYITKKSDWHGIPVQVDMFHKMDVALEIPHLDSSIRPEVNRDIDAYMPQNPPKEIVEYSMAKARLRQGANVKYTWRSVRMSVLKELWHNQSTWPELEDECHANKDDPQVKAMLASMKRAYGSRDPYMQAHRDRIAGEVPGVLRRIPDGTIYIAVEKNRAVLFFLFPRGLIFTYDEATVQHIFEDLATYAKYEPPPKPDEKRHALDDEWIQEHPEFSVEQGGYHGTYHWGCHHEEGHEEVTFGVKTTDTLLQLANTARMREELMEGACGALTRALYFWFGAGPELANAV